MVLTKADLAAKVARELETTQQRAKELIDGCLDEVAFLLQQGHAVKISGFGNFECRDKPARPGRNPKTGEDVMIQARRVVSFKPGQKLKLIVAN